jgi:hypothetical protein
MQITNLSNDLLTYSIAPFLDFDELLVFRQVFRIDKKQFSKLICRQQIIDIVFNKAENLMDTFILASRIEHCTKIIIPDYVDNRIVVNNLEKSFALTKASRYKHRFGLAPELGIFGLSGETFTDDQFIAMTFEEYTNLMNDCNRFVTYAIYLLTVSAYVPIQLELLFLMTPLFNCTFQQRIFDKFPDSTKAQLYNTIEYMDNYDIKDPGLTHLPIAVPDEYNKVKKCIQDINNSSQFLPRKQKCTKLDLVTNCNTCPKYTKKYERAETAHIASGAEIYLANIESINKLCSSVEHEINDILEKANTKFKQINENTNCKLNEVREKFNKLVHKCDELSENNNYQETNTLTVEVYDNKVHVH